MGWFHTQEEEEGISIEGRGCCIDITILEIRSVGDNKKVKLQIDGVDGLNTLELSADDGLVSLVDDIKVGVRHERNLGKKQVSMHYDAPLDYQFEYKEH